MAIDIQDKQIDVNNPDALGRYGDGYQQRGKAHNYGAELEIKAKPADRLTFFAPSALKETRLDRWAGQSSTGVVDDESRKLVYAPVKKVKLNTTPRFL